MKIELAFLIRCEEGEKLSMEAIEKEFGEMARKKQFPPLPEEIGVYIGKSRTTGMVLSKDILRQMVSIGDISEK